MKRIIIFLGITFVLTWAYEFGVVYPATFGILGQSAQKLSTLLVAVAMFFPAIGVVLTRLITKEGFTHSLIKPRSFKKSFRWFLLAWFGPPLLAVVGAGLYFAVFPHEFTATMDSYVAATQQALSAQGAPVLDAATLRLGEYVNLIFGILIGGVINVVVTFGEEWGWRGYLMPKLARRLPIIPTLIVSGAIWGLWHAPLIIIGHNYGTGYFSWPCGGIAAMCVSSVVLGVFLSYVTIRSGSCLSAAVGHSAYNASAATGVIFLLGSYNPFVGPAPTGIIGAVGFIVLALLMARSLRRQERAHNLVIPQAGLKEDKTYNCR